MVEPRIILIAIVLIASGATRATAQDNSAALEGRLQEAARRHTFLRVTLGDSSRVDGRVQAIDLRSARIDNHTLVFDSIIFLEQRIRQNSGARTGAILGAVAGLVITYPLRRLDDSNPGPGDENFASLAGLAYGAVVGMLVGMVIKPGGTTWERVWP